MPFPLSSLTRFLSGLGAEWMPGNPVGRSAGWQPSNPDGLRAAWQPSNPDGLSGSWQPSNPPHKPKLASGKRSLGVPADAFDMRSLQSWEGVDPPWTYANEHTLLMQALRKSRAKVARLSDPVVLDAFSPQVQPLDPRTEPLWRWAPKYRMAAVTAELSSRIVVIERAVYLLGPRSPGHKLLELPDDFASLPGYDETEQLDAVLRAAVEREDRLPEILTQAADIWPFFESVTGVSPAMAAEFAELLRAAHDWLENVLMLLKHNTAAWRPVQRSSLVMPVIPTPGHGSLPSGHATVAAFNAELLRLLMYAQGPQSRLDMLDRLARRIAFNRVVAGVHFPVDSQAGYALGRQLARAVATLAGQPQCLPPLAPQDVFKPPYTLPELEPDQPAQAAPAGVPLTVAPAKALSILWAAAAQSLARQRV